MKSEKYTHLLQICVVDLTGMQLICKFNNGNCFLLCVIDINSKYTGLFLHKKGITITNSFQNFLDKSGRKPNEIWVDKYSEFYKRLIKSWLQDNDIEMYSTHNEGKSVVAESLLEP